MVKFRFRSIPQDNNRTGSEKNDFMKILSIFCDQIWYLPILPKLLKAEKGIKCDKKKNIFKLVKGNYEVIFFSFIIG